jgi:hypothetical protein
VDILPEHLGNELVVVGNSNSVTIVYEDSESSSGWSTINIFTTNSNLNGIAVGEFDALGSDNEIAIIQSGAKLLKVQYEVPGYILYTPEELITAKPGFSISNPVILHPTSDFSSTVGLSIANADALLGDGITVTFPNGDSTSEYIPPEVVNLNISISEQTAPGEYAVRLSSSIPQRSSTPANSNLTFAINVEPANKPSFDMSIEPGYAAVIADHSITLKVKTETSSNWDLPISFRIRYLPPGISYSFSENTIQPDADSETVINLTLTTTPATPVGTYFIFITATDDVTGGFSQTNVIKLDVIEPVPDYNLVLEPNQLSIPINSSGLALIQGFSLFGFNEEVTVELHGLPNDIDYSITPESFTPTGNSPIIFSVNPGTEQKQYDITIKGISSGTGIIRTAFFTLIVLPEKPGFNVEMISEDQITVKKSETAELKLTIIPTNEFLDYINITITGLKPGVTWNQDISPVFIDSEESITISIDGLDKPGNYDIEITLTAQNISKDLDINIEVQAKDDKSDEPTTIELNQMIQILIIIIIFLVTIIFLYRFTKRLPSMPPKPEESEDKPKQKAQKKKQQPKRASAKNKNRRSKN